MYKDWYIYIYHNTMDYNHNIHPKIIKLFNTTLLFILSDQLMNSLFPISRYYDTLCIGYKDPLIWNSLSINIKKH